MNPRALLPAAALLLAACGAGSGPGASPTVLYSGIDLYTIARPTCPVQREGQTCTAAIAADVVITRSDGSVAAQAHTSPNGRGHVPLAAGVYTVTGKPGSNGFPRPPAAQTVTVPDAQFVHVQIVFDSGIR